MTDNNNEMEMWCDVCDRGKTGNPKLPQGVEVQEGNRKGRLVCDDCYAHERIIELMNGEVQYDRQGPPEQQFEIYDDGDHMLVKQGGGRYELMELAGVDEQGHTGQPRTLLQTEDEEKLIRFLESNL